MYGDNFMEQRNYWNDSRVRAGMVDNGKTVKENGSNYIVIECDNEPDIKILCKWEVCSTCEGEGTHVNPSIDAGGISSDDFREDPEFAEEYSRGSYDQTCNECKGDRLVPGVNREQNDAKMIERYDDYIREEQEYAAECAAERAMGA